MSAQKRSNGSGGPSEENRPFVNNQQQRNSNGNEGDEQHTDVQEQLHSCEYMLPATVENGVEMPEVECGADAEYQCATMILFKENGCKKWVCAEHKNQEKICTCLQKQEPVTCLSCEPEIKETSALKHFWLPGLAFIILNIIVFMPIIITQATSI